MDVKKTKLEEDIEEVINKMWEEYEITPNNVDGYEKPSNVAETTKKVNSLRNGIKNLGSINIDSIEEYKQTKERYDFMCEQRLDLENSISKLRDVVTDMTKIMKEQFEKNNKIKIIAMALLSIIIIGATISLFYVNKKTDDNKPKAKNPITSTTIPKESDKDYVDAISIDIPDYDKTDDKYITSGFTIYKDNLYANIVSENLLKEFKDKTITINNGEGYLIQKDITQVFRVTKDKGEYYYIFAINSKGELFYINNLVNSESKKFKVTKVSELKNIKDVVVKETYPMSAVAIDNKNKEHNLDDIIDKYAKLGKEE